MSSSNCILIAPTNANCQCTCENTTTGETEYDANIGDCMSYGADCPGPGFTCVDDNKCETQCSQYCYGLNPGQNKRQKKLPPNPRGGGRPTPKGGGRKAMARGGRTRPASRGRKMARGGRTRPAPRKMARGQTAKQRDLQGGCGHGYVKNDFGDCVVGHYVRYGGGGRTRPAPRRGRQMARGGRTRQAPARKMPHGGTAGGRGCKILTSQIDCDASSGCNWDYDGSSCY